MRTQMCSLVVCAAQGEALINDKINWLALFFAIYSVSAAVLASKCVGLQAASSCSPVNQCADKTLLSAQLLYRTLVQHNQEASHGYSSTPDASQGPWRAQVPFISHHTSVYASIASSSKTLQHPTDSASTVFCPYAYGRRASVVSDFRQ